MKKILLLLLFTVASYGQAVFDEGIQITNTESTTATKVNVQEANGKVNTKTINTAFNKNFGLNTGDVVGAATLLNQYSTTPLDWTATAFNSGQVVFYVGKQWISKMATVAGDVPAASSKWEEITFDALANKTVTVDQTIIDGSTNAVSSNAVFDALATKAPISAVHNPVTIGTANGLSLSTQQLSLGLASSSTTGALSGTDWNNFNSKFNTPTGLTTNYLPKWNGSGFGNSVFYEDATGLNINGVLKGITFDNPKIGAVVNSSGILHKIDSVNKWSINVGAGDGSENYNIYSFDTSKRLVSYKTNGNIEFIPDGGRVLINKTDDDLTNKLQVAGTISASPATTANQVPTWGQVQAAASSGRYTPTVNVITGATSVSVQSHTYIKIGNIVTVYGESLPTPVVAGVTVIYEISLPIARANTVTKALGFGTLNVAGGSTNQPVRLESSSATTVRISFNIVAGGTPSVLYSLQYDITQ